MSRPESRPNSGGDRFDMAKDGTTVPDDSTKPQTIPSVAHPYQYRTTKTSEGDPNFLGRTNMAETADNVADIPQVKLSSAYSLEHRSLPFPTLQLTVLPCDLIACLSLTTGL